MANGDFRVVPAVFTILLENNKVLLLRRANTKWLNGYYDLPAGHLEDQESFRDGAVRELLEETGVRAKPQDLELVHLHQNHHRPEEPHYGYIFLAKKWEGKPYIAEPEKCDDMQFFSLDNLPEKMPPYTRHALEMLGKEKISLSYHAPGSIKTD